MTQRQAFLARLQAEIDRIEDRGLGFDGDEAAPVFSLGDGDIDKALPDGGLRQGALHEILPATGYDQGAAAGFLTALMVRRLMTALPRQKILWCLDPLSACENARLYPPGLAAFGLDSARVILLRADRHADALWALEEGLRSKALAGVVGELYDDVALVASRRLALAAAAGGSTALLLRPACALGAGAARSRWRIAAAPSARHPFDPAAPAPVARFQADLVRSRQGKQRRWVMEWDDETHALAMVAALADQSAGRPAEPAARAVA